ncbi:MAG TPA: DUF3515 family protein [Rhodoglobus sp.]|nr:DUF3515 family protein [Rhodoglobus sp.]
MRAPAVAALAAVLLLTACTPAVTLEPAEDAGAVACAEVIVRLPDDVEGLPKRETDAQGTGAWGDPAKVLLRCGVPAPAPTSDLPCYTWGGVDWIVDDERDPVLVATTYGREPAIEVIIDDQADGIILEQLGAAVSRLPVTGACVGIDDLSEPSPAPAG